MVGFLSKFLKPGYKLCYFLERSGGIHLVGNTPVCSFATFIPLAMTCFILALAGCAKKQDGILNDTNARQSLLKDPATGEELVRTPFGLASKSKVHIIDSGYHISFEGDRLLKIHTRTGRMVDDYGIQSPRPRLRTAGNCCIFSMECWMASVQTPIYYSPFCNMVSAP
jgi:hypothetical protein